MAVEKSYWTGILLEKPIPDGSFLARSVDMTEFSDGKTIQYAEAGIEPEVFVNNTTFPIGSMKREDVPHEIPMDVFDTKNTRVSNIEKYEESPEKSRSVVRGHKTAIFKRNCRLALFNWCPSQHSQSTPVLTTSGAEVVEGSVTRKRMTFKDLLAMQTAFADMELSDGLCMCLSSKHLEDLRIEDAERYNQVLKDKNVAGFDLYSSSMVPTFDATTEKKEAFGAAKGANSMPTTVFWSDTEVMRANGDVDMFVREKDPDYRADILGFQKRFTALPLRSYGIGAMYSAKVTAASGESGS